MKGKRNRTFRKKKRAPFWGRFFRRHLGLEQLCDECSRPYLEKPLAEPIEQFVHGSAVALIFPTSRFGKKEFVVQFGRNRTDGRDIIVSRMVAEHDLRDIAIVASMAHKFIREQKSNLRLVSRR